MAGGVASGKTEFVSLFFKNDDNVLIYDGTMKNTAGFKIKLKKIKKHQPGAHVEVVYVLPSDITIAYRAFLGRKRKMSDQTFYMTHISSKFSTLEIMNNFPEVEVKMYINDLVSESANAEGVYTYYKIVSSRKSIKNLLSLEGNYLQHNLLKILKNV